MYQVIQISKYLDIQILKFQILRFQIFKNLIVRYLDIQICQDSIILILRCSEFKFKGIESLSQTLIF